jgi:hypothetical protein
MWIRSQRRENERVKKKSSKEMNREKVANRLNWLSFFLLFLGIGCTIASWYWDTYQMGTRIVGLASFILGFGFLYMGQSFYCAHRSTTLSEEDAISEYND